VLLFLLFCLGIASLLYDSFPFANTTYCQDSVAHNKRYQRANCSNYWYQSISISQ